MDCVVDVVGTAWKEIRTDHQNPAQKGQNFCSIRQFTSLFQNVEIEDMKLKETSRNRTCNVHNRPLVVDRIVDLVVDSVRDLVVDCVVDVVGTA